MFKITISFDTKDAITVTVKDYSFETSGWLKITLDDGRIKYLSGAHLVEVTVAATR